MACRFKLVEQYDIIDRLQRIQAPTLILAGNRDVLVSKRSLNKLHQGIPQSKLVRLPEAGHLGFVTHPERVAFEIRNFLQSSRAMISK
jgi:pimeloyl-ACP methyl ester carboxylesterase